MTTSQTLITHVISESNLTRLLSSDIMIRVANYLKSIAVIIDRKPEDLRVILNSIYYYFIHIDGIVAGLTLIYVCV